ncbi:MAG: DUF3336 domain-containing protein [Parahaliea sp.]
MTKTRKLHKLEREMDQCNSYEQWYELALKHDEISGMRRWRERDQSTQYDHGEIRMRLDRLRSLRARHDYEGLLFALNEGIHGNMGGMGRSSLYQRARSGTKLLIEQYIDEIDDSLRCLAELDINQISHQEKLDFFYRANICYGRSGLMLSGGGVLGFYHLGVVRVLLQQHLLPRVISGSSAGSLMAGLLGTRTNEELKHFFDPANLIFEAEREASTLSRIMLGGNSQLDVTDLENIVERLVGDLTFQEAYEKTGRQISITIAPAEHHQRSRLLNAITSPNVYVRSAVKASCSVPGVFPPVMLMAKNVHGEEQPYLPTRKWVDGSIADDLPAKRLSRLYSTNHYIVSMVNPIATPFLSRDGEHGKLRTALGSLGVGIGRELLNFYRGIAQKKGDSWPRVNLMLNSMHSLMDQEYSGDINIVPSFRWYNPAKVLSHPTEKELIYLMEAGQHSTFPQVEAIRICTKIGRTMEEILHRFEYGDLHQEEAVALKPRSSRRRPPATRSDRESLRRQLVARQSHDAVTATAAKSASTPGKKHSAAGAKKVKAKAKTKTKTDKGHQAA